jgi:hypothetical protein
VKRVLILPTREVIVHNVMLKGVNHVKVKIPTHVCPAHNN